MSLDELRTLDDALRDASEAADRSIAAASPGQPPSAGQKRRAVVYAAGAVALFGAAFATAALVDRGGDDFAVEATTNGQDPSQPATDEGLPGDGSDGQSNGAEEGSGAADGVTRFATQALPDGLTLTYSGPVADLGDPVGSYRQHLYGVPGREPTEGDTRLAITVSDGVGRPPGLPSGEDVDLDGAVGRLNMSEGALWFEAGPSLVGIWSSTMSEDELVAVASSVMVGADGGVEAPTDGPDGLRQLAAIDSVHHETVDVGSPPDGQVALYRDGSARYLAIGSRPMIEDAEQVYRWVAGAESEAIDGRPVIILAEHDDFGQHMTRLVWFESNATIEVTAFGLSGEEVRAAIAGAVPESGDPRVAVQTRVPPAEEEPAATEDLVAAAAGGRLVATVVPDGMDIVVAADHEDLGTPYWSAEQYIYGPSGLDIPGPEDEVLMVMVTDKVPGFFIGDPIEIGGHEGVVVDKAASGTSTDIQLAVGDNNVEFTARANFDPERVIAAAEQYVLSVADAGESPVPSTLGADLDLIAGEETAVWRQPEVNGTRGGSSVVYRDEDGDRQLQISTVSGSQAGLAWYSWIYPGRSTIVDVAGFEATSVSPADGVQIIRFELEGGQLIGVTAIGLTEQEALDAAGSLRAATPDEWDIGLP